MSSLARPLLLITVLLVALVAGPASAFYDEEREIEFAQSKAWFTATTTGVGNVDAELGEDIGWSTDAPSGNGGMTVATAHAGLASIFLGDEIYESQSFRASGDFTGYLENIALDLYYASPVQNLCGMGLSIDLTIDGRKIMDMAGIGNTADVTSWQAGDDLYLAQVALTGIADALENRGMLGEATTPHTIDIVALQYPLCQEAIWQYGSAEAPSSLTFNLDPEGSAVRLYTEFKVGNPPAPGE